MKKQLFSILAIIGTMSLTAQDLVSKKGENFLPEAGEFGISADATPFLNYFGNFLSSDNVAPTWNFLSNQTIVVRYFKESDFAYRGLLRIGLNSSSETRKIEQAGASAPTFPALPATVEDVRRASQTAVVLGGGIEMRRGATRLQGFYGADAMIGFMSERNRFEYGNALSSTVGVQGNTTNFGGNFTADTYGNQARITSEKLGSSFMFGVRAFAGVEYFVLPKISIGGEFGWGIGISVGSAGEREIESVNAGTVGTQTLSGTKGSGFSIDTDRNSFLSPSGQIRLNFYF